MREYAGFLVILTMLAVSAVFVLRPLSFTGFFVSVSQGETKLELWDLTDSEGGSYNVYAEGSPQGSRPNSTTLAEFFANYTNSTSGESVNGSGVVCRISFNISGGWSSPADMWFNSSSKLYEYNRTFPSRGTYLWNVTCNGSSQGYAILNATDNITITNTPAGIYVPLAAKTCYEDEVCTHDFSADCYDVDDIDQNNLTYGYKAGTEFEGFSMNSTTGLITVNITRDSDCGDFFVTLLDKDPPGWGATADKEFIVNAVNDRPVLGSVPTSSYQNSTLYYDIDATDEENPSGPLYFNITFISCYRPFNSQHTNVTDCSNLFTIDHSTGVINRSTNFSNYEVGNYTINFTVTDPGDNLTGTSIPPYTWLANKTDSYVVNFTVIDLNDRPLIEPVPNQFWTQNERLVLVINASDIDNGTLVFNATTLYRNLSVYMNSSLFPITVNQTLHLDNGTSLGNATMNFTIGNHQVGNYTLNISVSDGRENGTYSILVNFTIANINDPPVLNFSCRDYAVEGLAYVCNVGENTSDPDVFPPGVYNDSVNGTLTFHLNFTYCNKTFNQSDTNCSIFTIDSQTGLINYTNPLRKDAGNYTINISVTDGGNLTAWTEFNLTVVPDYRPNITFIPPPQNATQNQPFFLYVNATDEDGPLSDNLTFRTETYQNGTLLSETLFPIETDRSLWASANITKGVMNYTSVNNSQVGNYTVRIIVNDTWGREDYIEVNFTVYNVNDPPVLNFSCQNYTYEDDVYSCNVGENTSDADMQTPYGDTLVFNLTFISGPPLFAINSSTGLINFIASNDSWANNSYNFTYVLNITVTDSNGSVDWAEFNLTVHAVNDAPEFNFTNTSVYVNSTFFENLSAETLDEEGNTPFFFNLTFVDCSKANTSDTNCSVFGINHSTGVINFTALEKDIGNYTINVTVTDSGNTTEPHNATGWKIVNFRILTLNRAPQVAIGGVIPSDDFYENDTVIFAISVSDPDGDALYCTWFKNGTEIDRVDDCHEGSKANQWEYTPGFDESGNWTFRLEVTDSYLTSYAEKDVTIRNKNRPPEMVYPIQNQSWNMNTENKNIILSYNFRDPDNENNVTNDDNSLTINYTRPQHIAVMIDSQTGVITIPAENWTGSGRVTLTPQTDWYGTDYIVFTVSDGEFNVTSNNVTLNVSYTETPTETIVQQTTGGGGAVSQTQTKIASLTITTSPLDRVSSYTTTTTTITLENTGEVALNGITISSFVNETEDISLELSREYVSQLGVGESVDSNLTITTHELTKNAYEIKITGSVNSPKFNQSAVIYLRPLLNETKIEEKIQLARDLFQDNPECLDLTELIIEAERELGGNNLERARELTETALKNCRDIIKYTNMTRRKVTPEAEEIPIKEVMIALLSIALATILVYLWLEKRERK